MTQQYYRPPVLPIQKIVRRNKRYHGVGTASVLCGIIALLFAMGAVGEYTTTTVVIVSIILMLVFAVAAWLLGMRGGFRIRIERDR